MAFVRNSLYNGAVLVRTQQRYLEASRVIGRQTNNMVLVPMIPSPNPP